MSLCSTGLRRGESLFSLEGSLVVFNFRAALWFDDGAYVSGCCSAASVGARMAAMFTCCLGCCGDGGSGHIPLKEMPTVQLDTHHMGTLVCRPCFHPLFGQFMSFCAEVDARDMMICYFRRACQLTLA